LVDYHEELVTALSGIGIPVYYEHFKTERSLPCITYLEIFNGDLATGDTLSYSDMAFQIKIWDKTISSVQTIFNDLDNTLKPLGFNRTFSVEVMDGDLNVKILRYNGIGWERV
jgi:hypothetical protein